MQIQFFLATHRHIIPCNLDRLHPFSLEARILRLIFNKLWETARNHQMHFCERRGPSQAAKSKPPGSKEQKGREARAQWGERGGEGSRVRAWLLTGWSGFGESQSPSWPVGSCPTFQQLWDPGSGARTQERATAARQPLYLQLPTVPHLIGSAPRNEEKRGRKKKPTIREAAHLSLGYLGATTGRASLPRPPSRDPCGFQWLHPLTEPPLGGLEPLAATSRKLSAASVSGKQLQQ